MITVYRVENKRRKTRRLLAASPAEKQAASELQAMLDAASPEEIAALSQALVDAEDAANRLIFRLDVVADGLHDAVLEARLTRQILQNSNRFAAERAQQEHGA